MQTSVYILLKIGLESILLEIPDRFSEDRASIKAMIDQVQKEFDTLDGIPERKFVNSYWPGIKQFLDQKYSIKIQQVTLDTIQKMITNKLFAIEGQIEIDQLYIMDDIVQSVVQCYPLSKLPDDSIQLQIIKVFLTIATSCIIHGKSLESILRICMLIHLQSKSSSASQITAKAALMQIINMLFTIIESEYSKITLMKKEFEDDFSPSIMNASPVDRNLLEDIDFSLSIAEEVYANISQPLLEPPGKFGYCHQCLCPAHSFDSELERPKCGSCKMTVASGSSTNDTLCKISKAFILKSHELYLELVKEDCLIGLELLFDTLKKYERKGTEKAKILCYELILSILNNAGPCFKSDSEFITPLGTKLSISLSSNGLSSNPVLFELCLGIFLTLVLSFRSLLKTQIEILFREIYLRVFDISTSTMHQRLLVAQSLIKICSTSQILADIYVNYDCDLAMECIYEKIILCFAKISMFEEFFKSISISYVTDNASSYSHILNTIKKSNSIYTFHTINYTDLNILAIKGFIAIIRSLMQLKKEYKNENSHKENIKENISDESYSEPLDTEDYSLQMIEESKTKKQLLRQGIYLFNTLKHPYDGIKFLARHGLLDINNVASIARFLHKSNGIDKKALGTFLGEPDSRSILIMHAFIDAIDFTEIVDFVRALRLLLSTFHLPGESQKIDRIMEKFADRYCECNPTVFSNADIAYTLAYSIIMLNTDLHSIQVKVKITKDSFIKNNSSIYTNEITDDTLSKIYDDILNEEIVLDSTEMNKHSDKLSGIYRQFRNSDNSHDIETERIKTRSEALFKEARKAMQYVIASPEQNILSDMIRILALPMLGSLFIVFSSFQETISESTDKEELVRLVLQCFIDMIQMLSNSNLQTEKGVYLLLLYQCTKAFGIESISLKKIWAIKSLLFVALSCGEHFEFDEWVYICKCLSMLDMNHLIETPVLKTQIVVKPEKKQSRIPHTTIAASGLIYPKQLDTLLSRTLDITSDQCIEFTSASHIPVSKFSFRSKRASILAFLQNLVQEQDIPHIIDVVFTNSISLNAISVMELFRALCKVSTEELFGDENIESVSPSISQESIFDQSNSFARIFCLQKIVETAYYNMDRIRFEWSQIWKILQPHFNKAGLHPQMHICTLSIDSLRQLTVRFLERDELGRYHTQNELLKSFEYIMRHTTFLPIREQILSSLDQMISIQARNIKSGWKTILSVLSRSVNQIELQSLSLTILSKISSTQCFDLLLVSTGCLADYVLCLTNLICYSKGEDISLAALKILQECHSKLYDLNHETAPELERIHEENVSDESTGIENQFHFKWLPLFTCFTRIITDSSSSFIRTQAVDILFQMLMRLDRWTYTDKYWKTIYRCVLFPIFELLSDDERKAMTNQMCLEQRKYSIESSDAHLTSIWIHMLRLWIDLIVSFSDILLNTEYSLLSSFLTLLESCIHHSEEHLAQSCILCFYHLICKVEIWGLQEWSCMQTFLTRIVHWTLPIEEVLSERFTLDDFHIITWKCSLHLGIVQVIKDIHSLCINEMHPNKKKIFCKLFYEYPLSHILSSLQESFNFAKTFNSNVELRTRLAEAGNIPSIDGIVLRKQQFNSLTEYLCILAYSIYYYTTEKILDIDYLSPKIIIPFEKCTKMVMINTIKLSTEITKEDSIEELSDLECWISLTRFVLHTLLSMNLFFYYTEDDQIQKHLRILVKSLSDDCLEFVSIQGDFSYMCVLDKERSTLYPTIIEFIKTVQNHFLKI